MHDYPLIDVSIDGYTPEWSDGAEVVRAESGEVWLYRHYAQEQLTLTIVHPALLAAQEATLRQFYRDHKHEYVRFHDLRTQEIYICTMPHPPRLVRMRSGKHADIEMTLLGVRE